MKFFYKCIKSFSLNKIHWQRYLQYMLYLLLVFNEFIRLFLVVFLRSHYSIEQCKYRVGTSQQICAALGGIK